MLSVCRRSFAFAIMLTFLAVLLPPSALADPYPGSVSAAPYNETTIQVSWSANNYAERYHVYRNSSLIAEVDLNTTEYLDTDISSGTAYWYSVATVDDGTGQEYLTGPVPAAWTIPLTAPVITVDSTFRDIYAEAFWVDLSWTAVQCASGYELYLSTDSGPYLKIAHTTSLSYTDERPLPAITAHYSYKVRAYHEYWYIVSDGHVFDPGPFSDTADANCWNFDIGKWKELLKVWKAPPWPDPWQADWIVSLLDAYGDPVKWPAGAGVDSLAALAGHLLYGRGLTQEDRLLAQAIHPHGLALLTGAFLAPPDKAQAEALSGQLRDLSGLLSGQLPEKLRNGAMEGYLTGFQRLCGLTGLDWETDKNEFSSLNLKLQSDGRTLFSSAEGVPSLFGELVLLQTPEPLERETIAPALILPPGMIRILPTATPTPAPFPVIRPVTRP